MRRHIPMFFLMLLFLVTPPAFADDLQRLAKRLTPVSGVVVMPLEAGEYLIDLDAAKGVAAGDLVSVIVPGEKIIHPETQEVLGRLVETKALLEVTRVKSGYSYARLIEGKGVARGDAVRRFAAMPARIVGAEDFPDIASELRARFPEFDWVEGGGTEAALAGVTLVVSDGSVRLFGADERLLGRFSLSGGSGSAGIVASAPPPVVGAPAAPAVVVSKAEEEPTGVWYGPDWKVEVYGVVTGDFTGSGADEIAVAVGNEIRILRFSDGVLVPIAQQELGVRNQVLTLDRYDLDGNGRDELYITAKRETPKLNSMVMVVEEGKCRIVEDFIPYFFRTVRFPEEGPVLLGQRMGLGGSDYVGPVFRVGGSVGAVGEGEAVALPPQVIIHGFSPLLLDGEEAYAYLTEFGKLQVLNPIGDVLWEGSERFGGTEAGIEKPDPNMRTEWGMDTRMAFLRAGLLFTAEGELLVPVNDGEGLMSRNQTFKSSYLVALTWDGRTMREVWRTMVQSAYMPDFSHADYDGDGRPEILGALRYSRDGLFSSPRSSLVGYELP